MREVPEVYVPLPLRSGEGGEVVVEGITGVPTPYSSLLLSQADRGGLCRGLIEEPAAVENLVAILKVDGLDGCFVGAGDIALVRRAFDEFSPASWDPREPEASCGGLAAPD